MLMKIDGFPSENITFNISTLETANYIKEPFQGKGEEISEATFLSLLGNPKCIKCNRINI